jgi:hypothetical protein
VTVQNHSLHIGYQVVHLESDNVVCLLVLGLVDDAIGAFAYIAALLYLLVALHTVVLWPVPQGCTWGVKRKAALQRTTISLKERPRLTAANCTSINTSMTFV